MIKPIIICLDFDGTCVTHDFPKVGQDIGAVQVLRRIVAEGHKIILWTMRSDVEKPESESAEIVCDAGNYLTDAVNWFKDNEIPLWGINRNPDQHSWTHSPKAYGQLYIDDAAIGAPLVYESTHERPYMNWLIVQQMLEESGVITPIKLPSADQIIAAAEQMGLDPEWALAILKDRTLMSKDTRNWKVPDDQKRKLLDGNWAIEETDKIENQ